MNIQQAELDDARKGTIYFLGKLHVIKEPGFDLGLISNFVSGTSIVSDLTSASASLLESCSVGKKVIEGINTVITPIRQLIGDFMKAVTDKILSVYGEACGIVEWLGEFTSWAVSTFAGSLGDIIPGWGYVQNAADMYDGVKKAVVSAIKWLGQIYSGWGVNLLEGGPGIMAEAIARHNATQLAGGLKDMAVTSVKTGLQAAGDAAAGVGAIVGALTGILQRIANLIEYCVQRFLLNRSINQASEQWHQEQIEPIRHDKFNLWFRRTCALTPIVAALTMSSGFTAHPYRFLALISSSDEIASQKAFDDGVKHIEKLKDLSRDYIKAYQDSYRIRFVSDDAIVSARMKDITS